MKKKYKLVIGLVVLLAVAGFVIYQVITMQAAAEKAGKEKYDTAISEILTTDPGANNPCLGHSISKTDSFAQFSGKSVNEIKEMILKDPGSC
jgi:hypothetical protein